MATLSRRTLPEQVADAILDRIMGEGLTVGDPLPSTSELAERFDVSVVVVREALAILGGRGIVVRRQGREPLVARPGPEVLDSIFRLRVRQDSVSLEEFHQCRAALELQSAALAAGKQDRDARAAILRPSLEALRRAKGLIRIVDADQGFHLALAELSGNHAVLLILSSLASVLRESIEDSARRLLDRYGKEGPAVNARVHERVADSVIDGHRAAAIEAMAAHFLMWGDDFDFGSIDYFQRAGDGGGAADGAKRRRRRTSAA